MSNSAMDDGDDDGTTSRDMFIVDETTDEASGAAGVDYEVALAKIGIGRFHVLLLLLCGWANASDAAELSAVKEGPRDGYA